MLGHRDCIVQFCFLLRIVPKTPLPVAVPAQFPGQHCTPIFPCFSAASCAEGRCGGMVTLLLAPPAVGNRSTPRLRQGRMRRGLDFEFSPKIRKTLHLYYIVGIMDYVLRRGIWLLTAAELPWNSFLRSVPIFRFGLSPVLCCH